jgi:outer membrane autotransporter protein
MRHRSAVLTGAVVAALTAVSPRAEAANAAFQNFFFNVCPGSTGALAARCAVTTGGAGNVSTDSESSLNPSQALSQHLAPLDLAQMRSAEARDRGEQLREDRPGGTDQAKVAIGPFSLLVNGRGARFERERDPLADQERGIDGDRWGVEVGLERRVTDRAYAGAILAVERTAFDFDAERPGVNFSPAARAGDTDTDAYSLTAYLTLNLSDRAFLDLSAGYARQDYTITRNAVFQESTRTVPQTDVRARGDTNGNVMWASFNVGYDWATGGTSFGPYAGVTYSRSRIDAYSERDLNGSGLNMAFGGSSETSSLAHAGLRLDRAISLNNAVVVPQLRVEYLYRLQNDAPDASARFLLDAQATNFAFAGDEPDSGVLSVGLGVTALLRNGWTWFANVDHLASGDLDRQRLTLGVRVEL